MKYHQMRPDEYFVLQHLDGHHSLQDIKEAYESQYAPQKVSVVELNQLLFRFHQSGLTVSDASAQGDRLNERREKEWQQKWKQHLMGVLFIRFPGVDPDPLLRRVYPWIQPMLGRLPLACLLAFCLTALMVFLTHWDQFTTEFPEMSQWLRFDSVLILAAVIGSTKVLHELGHAFACKHFGGECHQIGPMLLVFTPALYCDTSDSWMLPNRFARAAVGMAGIATEIVMAAIATMVWAHTGPGLVHSIAMNVMLVCSVSTLLFNANPLLRYDGYYVLSDLCDVPNLGERSKKLLSHHVNHLLWGADERSEEPISHAAHIGMLAYAVMAAVYRWTLTLAILWIVSLILRPYRLESLGRLLCLFAGGGMVYALLRGPFQFLRNPARRRKIQMKRTALSMTLLAGMLGCCFLPLPAGLSGSASIRARGETPVYVTTAGQLITLHQHPGDVVLQGDPIATLANPEVEMQRVKTQGRYDVQASIVESIQRSMHLSPEASNDLPGQEALLDDLKKRLATRQARYEGLTITASADGRLITAPRRSEDAEADSELRLVRWSGFPTDAANQNCQLESGSELISIATSDDWDAELVLSQSEVQRIAEGAAVKLVLESMPSQVITGTVVEISRSQWNDHQHANRRDDPRATRQTGPPGTSYLVRVELDSHPGFPMVTGATASGRIATDPQSIADRVIRTLSGLLRFR